MAGTIRLVLGDQLSRSLSGLAGLDKERDVVMMAEVIEEVTYVRHHKRKVAFLFSAMRHFADELRGEASPSTMSGLMTRPTVAAFPVRWRAQ